MEMRGILCCFVALLFCGHTSAGPATSPMNMGTCWVMGDPHYRTFNGHYYNFNGNCTYTMAKNCHVDKDHPAFEVNAKNENQGSSQMSSVGVVSIEVYGYSISIVRAERGFVRIYGIKWNLPITFENGLGQVKLYQRGLSVVMEADFGLTVQYDWEQYLVLTMPGRYMGKVCGLCGNFNGKQEDDLTTPGGSLAGSVVALGNSWRVPGSPGDAYCCDECTEQCEHCKSSLARRLEADVFCSLLTHVMDGPFSACHAVIDPKFYHENCKYDFCRGKGAKKYLCDTLQVYMVACQRAGVKVHDWRSFAGCPKPESPAQSNYEFCGSACPATCEDPSAPSNCKAPCEETYSCVEGHLRSGNKCVPKAQCGCQYNGRYLQAGESIWADENCQLQCNCSTTGGKVQTQQASCPLGHKCQVINGIRDCYPMSYATCMVSGDPHYLTFDGEKYNFQGTCMYQLAGVCSNSTGLEHFEVLVQNDGRDKKVGSVTKLVEMMVYGNTIVISKEHPGLVMVNGELAHLPVTLGGNKVQAYRSGFFAVVQTDFGVKVSYDWSSTTLITVPDTYAGATCGLCGNYNHEPNDDLQTRSGKQAATAAELGQSWRVATIPGCVDGCKGPCPDCDITQKLQYETNQYCGLLRDPSGPFRDCHATLNPSGFFQDCLYDVCLYQGAKSMQCKTLSAYTAACQQKGATVYSWRTAAFCDVQCPANSHYELCANGCPATCKSLSAPAGCKEQCQEACECDDGFLLSGDQCVPFAQCGCLYNDQYYKIGQVFYPNGQCEEECVCNGTVECKPFTCGPYEKCAVKNGVRECQPTGQGMCSISGDPHYHTFDNSYYDFQGTCTYTAAEGCHLEGTRLHPFLVAVENEKWYAMIDEPRVSVAKLVAVEVYGYILILRRNQIGMVMVNGVMTYLPVNLNHGQVQVYQDGSNDVITTDFGLKVTYDLVYHVTITVPGNYHGKTCGLCGNFNGNKNDEFQLPDGKATKDVNSFGAAWTVSVPGVVCDNGCSGDVCPKCDEKKKTVLESDCSIIINPKGPFATCHSVINPTSYFRDCVYDVCMGVGDQQFALGDRNMLCHSIAAYMSDCQNAGVAIQTWRTPTFCPLSCPANSHYQICAETCATSCPGLVETISCPTTCAESCACNSGYFFNGTGCVEWDQCSCYYDGRTIKIGETVVLDDCLSELTCQKSGVVLSRPMRCRSDELCQVKSGVQGCYARQCLMEAGGSLTMFSGRDGSFTVTGAFEMVEVCGAALVEEWFRVVVHLQACGETGLRSIAAVYVFFQDLLITVNGKHETWVNGKKATLPSQLKNEISIKVSDKTVIIEKKSGLHVSYSLSQEISITVSDQMADKVCGACGKLTSNTIAEFVQEKTPAFMNGYMASWTASDFPKCGM